MLDIQLYEGREQTYIKHLILERYLQKLAYKKGTYGRVLNYVDCFAGPWQHVSGSLDDTSPMIAIKELRAARDRLRSQNPSLKIRCLFIESQRESCELLRQKTQAFEDIHVQVINGTFEDSIETILRFTSGIDSFSFFFIDPTGWSGYALNTIRPLLRHPSSEVLINFMTKDILRFIDHDRPTDVQSFNSLFGTTDFRAHWKQKQGLDREDAIIETYAGLVREAGKFQFATPTVVLNPLKDRTHFHLIYATRKIEGLRVFRNEAERQAQDSQRTVRHQAALRQVEKATGQLGLFSEPVGPSRLDELRTRYHSKARKQIEELIQSKRRVAFDDLEAVALQFPFMHTQELKAWLDDLKNQGKVRYEGLAPGARVIMPNKNHYVLVA